MKKVHLVTIRLSDIQPRPWSGDWGPWKLNCSNYTLEHPNGYYVDLERCLTSAQVLDHICQITQKKWGSDDRLVAGLVRALIELLWPQGWLCGSGISREMTRLEVRQRIDEHRRPDAG
jgi:hypothetical protein